MSKPAKLSPSAVAVPFLLLLLLAAGTVVHAAEPMVTSQPPLWYGAVPAKAVVDTVTLMGPGGLYPYRGDFETAVARPGGDGALPDGWTSVDGTEPVNHWHVDTLRSGPDSLLVGITGKFAWCGDTVIASCGASDPVGGYGNYWKDILEFRKTVAGASSVRVQATLQYDAEPDFDYVMLQRRTALNPNFESLTGGQGLSWTGNGLATVDYTFNYLPSELYLGTDIAVAFIFTADGGYSDGDCFYPSSGGARVDNITVTLNGTPYTQDFESGSIGPDWAKVRNQGVGDYARVWNLAGDLDDCASNYSKLVAFLDDGLVVPGTGGTRGDPGLDYGPGGWVVNGRGGMRPTYGLDNLILSPVMDLPDPTAGGLTLAFDVYRHELLNMSTAGVFYTWEIRSTAGGDITQATWKDRNFVYYGGPSWIRSVNEVSDLLVPGATQVQLRLGAMQLNGYFCYGCGWGKPSPAPYFDNINVKSYRGMGPRIVVTDTRLANDTFPASGTLDLANLGANSCRFDMAANISLKTHSRNDPGDSIYIDVTPRSGGTLSAPIMYWEFATKNPLFTDAHRTALAAGQTSGAVTGRVTRNSAGSVVANRYNFDLPDTGMLFPGDVLHYYFAATDAVAGDSRTATAPADLTGYGMADASVWPWLYTVNCLPSVSTAQGAQPSLLLWNDAGNRGNDDEWAAALRSLCMRRGIDYEVFNTHGAASGVGNGLGGRATAAQVAGYADMLYTCGDLGAYTLSNGDYSAEAGNDLGLLEAWFGLGGRDLFLAGDDLANSLYSAGTAARAFLADRMGLAFTDGDVRDNIDGQAQPRVVAVAGNPVFATAGSWILNGGCTTINDFDNVVPLAGAVRLAQFTGTDGVSTPYTMAAATLRQNGTNRVVSLDHDLSYIIDDAKLVSPLPRRALVLGNVLDYFQAAIGAGDCFSGTPTTPAASRFAVTCHPNPFNPSVTLHYALPKPGPVTMKVFDARGTLVRTLIDGPVAQAEGDVTWNGTDQRGGRAPSGLYFVETRAGDQVDVRKVTMLK